MALISIVDDDIWVRESLSSLMRSVGQEVRVFASAEEFLNSAHPRKTDCLLLDVRLPGMSGIELHRHLLSRNCKLPVIFITAHASDDRARSEAASDWTVAYLIKPFSEVELLGAVEAALKWNPGPQRKAAKRKEVSMRDTGALVYVVDDDPFARNGLADLIRSAGLMAMTFASAEEFLTAPRPKAPSCLVLDVNLPGINGLDLQQALAKSDVQIPIIFLTAHGDIPMTVRAVKAGAANLLTKPFDDEELLKAVRQCIASCDQERLHLEPGISAEYCFEDIVGKSPAIQKVLQQVAIVAPTDSTVLLHGETGTGKELIARSIHNLSSRRERTFVRMNCAAIPAGLLESELFGHEKGAFTGALMLKKGRFELADGGSLFLNEIGDISLELQPKLLRAVQEREFERLGSTRTIHVNVRLIAATHRNLPELIREGKFREDLFYRLNVFPVAIPPLRERREDIPLLVNYFVSKLSREMGRQIKTVPPRTMELLTNHPWRGNVRELANFIERAVILSQGEELRVPMGEFIASESPESTPISTFEHAERNVIMDALKAASGRIAGRGGAAERLGLKRTTLQNKMQKLNISRAAYSA